MYNYEIIPRSVTFDFMYYSLQNVMVLKNIMAIHSRTKFNQIISTSTTQNVPQNTEGYIHTGISKFRLIRHTFQWRGFPVPVSLSRFMCLHTWRPSERIPTQRTGPDISFPFPLTGLNYSVTSIRLLYFLRLERQELRFRSQEFPFMCDQRPEENSCHHGMTELQP